MKDQQIINARHCEPDCPPTCKVPAGMVSHTPGLARGLRRQSFLASGRFSITSSTRPKSFASSAVMNVIAVQRVFNGVVVLTGVLDT
jgi:hypothetical protein